MEDKEKTKGRENCQLPNIEVRTDIRAEHLEALAKILWALRNTNLNKTTKDI